MKRILCSLVFAPAVPQWISVIFFGAFAGGAAAFAAFDFRFSSAPVETLPLGLLEQAKETAPAPAEERVAFVLPPTPARLAEEFGKPRQALINPAVVLNAIAAVESQGNPAQVGRLGERGLYQFRRTTWRQHTRESFSLAHHPEISTLVARRHYDWLVRQLQLHGFEANPYEVALAWNAGLGRVLTGKLPKQSHHYAQRVLNLVEAS